MTQAALANRKRFERRTTLAAHEYRKNFHQIDIDVIRAVTSPEADAVTPLMSKIYLRLVDAPAEFWEQKGVLHFSAQVRGGKLIKASDVLCAYLCVTRATFNKARKWMHEEGVIGYYAAKNGVGIRIFLNRAASSIGTKSNVAPQKILQFSHGTFADHSGTQDVPAFNEPFGYSDDSDKGLNPPAPKNGADTQPGNEVHPNRIPPVASIHLGFDSAAEPRQGPPASPALRPNTVVAAPPIPVAEIVAHLKRELEPAVKTAAAQAAAREHERTRQWLDRHGIPKATRVAQKEAFNVLRSHGVIDRARERARAELEVGRSTTGSDGARVVNEGDDPHPVVDAVATTVPPLTPEQIAEVAAACVALREVQGKAVDETLSGISAEAGGWVPPGDVAKVREAAHALTLEHAGKRHMPDDSAAE